MAILLTDRDAIDGKSYSRRSVTLPRKGINSPLSPWNGMAHSEKVSLSISLIEKESLSPLSPWRVSLFSTLSLSCLEAHILQLHDGYIVAGPECGVNPSPGRGCWGNGWSLPSWENGNWWPLFQKALVLQATGFPQGISTNFKFRIFFFFHVFQMFQGSFQEKY